MKKGMTVEELNILIKEKKVEVYDYMREVYRLERRDLDNAGYKGMSNSEAAADILKNSISVIENMIRLWEKKNPG